MPEKYRNFTVDEFAADDFFRQWVLENEPDASLFWTQWIEKYPEKRQDIVEAIALLKTFHIQEATLKRPEIDHAVQKTLIRINDQPDNSEPLHRRSLRTSMRYAAAIVLLLGVWWWSGTRFSGENRTVNTTSQEGLSLNNTQTFSIEETLPDGSKVILDPESTIRYSDALNGERTVFLSGSAFFDVVRNPDRPFKVITNDLVTQVLGTSFKISSDLVSRQTMVRVITGKVEVSARNKSKGRGNNTILYPNQEIVYREPDNQMKKAVVADPVEIQKPVHQEFIYEDTSIGLIFDELEVQYGVSISYDKDLLADCQITASFGNETFWEKLNLICRPVRATVEERDGEIFIESNGCNF